MAFEYYDYDPYRIPADRLTYFTDRSNADRRLLKYKEGGNLDLVDIAKEHQDFVIFNPPIRKTIGIWAYGNGEKMCIKGEQREINQNELINAIKDYNWSICCLYPALASRNLPVTFIDVDYFSRQFKNLNSLPKDRGTNEKLAYAIEYITALSNATEKNLAIIEQYNTSNPTMEKLNYKPKATFEAERSAAAQKNKTKK